MKLPPFRLPTPMLWSRNVIVWLAICVCFCAAFNIDIKKPIVHHKSNTSFGYSLDFFREHYDSESNTGWL
uniref:Secreted protein n=1 Tax=Syphacia muris TaxID=451379 RepID=A0A0N5AWV4_9BILA